jgi:hypothetical protein
VVLVVVVEVVVVVVCVVQLVTISAPMIISPSHDARPFVTERRFTSGTTLFQDAVTDPPRCA